jgi:hypothetical protein
VPGGELQQFSPKQCSNPFSEGDLREKMPAPNVEGHTGAGRLGVRGSRIARAFYFFSCFYFINVSDIGNISDMFCQNSG